MSKLRKAKYKSVIKAANKFQPWDYGFILDIEKAALKHMADYIKNKGIHVNADRDAERIKLTIKLLDIAINNTCEFELVGTGIIYVNTRNKHRYFRKDLISEQCYNLISNITIREEKAWYLYCKMREYWFRTFWD